MPQHITKQNDILERMHGLDIFSELVAQKNGQYEHELDLDVILYGRGYAGGLVGPYVRMLIYEEEETLICEGDWSAQRQCLPPRSGESAGEQSDELEESKQEWDGNSFYVLVDGTLKVEFKGEKPYEHSEPGTLIGAMMLLEGERADATVSVPAGATATVLEFKRPAIRLLRKYPQFSRAFDEHSLEYGLKSTLRDVRKAGAAARTPFRAFLSKLSRSFRSGGGDKEFRPEQWKEIAGLTQFKVYDKNHVLFGPGQPVTDIFLIKKGWVQLARVPAGDAPPVPEEKGDGGQQGVRYLGPGNCLGLSAISDGGATWRYSAISRARTEMLVVPVATLRENPRLADTVRGVFSDFSEVDQEKLFAHEPESVLAARREEIMSGLADGTNLLLMDMDLCVRCGNCSLACHHVHGQSRLVRRGIQIERPRKPDAKRLRHVLAPSVCLHCQDPECLTGCPTGSIGRYPGGQIDINPHTCIGCGDCATQCPYNAIALVSRKDLTRKIEVELKPAEATAGPAQSVSAEKDQFVAVKCNLCQGTPINPGWARREAYSCEENCPTGALVRVNPREYFSELGNVIGTIFIDQKRAIGRNIHRRDWPARFWHAGGILATLAVLAAAVWAAYRYGLDATLPGTTWTLRWLTGFVGLGAAAVALCYFPRKQVYRWRCGPLRYWLLAHIYFGAIAASSFLVHGGRHSGGLLTSALMVSFDLVIASGLFGFACYKLAPRIMTRIEGEPLLIEDLEARRAELQDKLKQFDPTDERLRPLISRPVPGRLFTARYLWQQFWRREPLTVLHARAREEFGTKADELGLDRATRARLIEAIEAAATARRVEALIYLHKLLKLWLAPHVAFTVLMLVLLSAHLIQVLVFAVH